MKVKPNLASAKDKILAKAKQVKKAKKLRCPVCKERAAVGDLHLRTMTRWRDKHGWVPYAAFYTCPNCNTVVSSYDDPAVLGYKSYFKSDSIMRVGENEHDS